MCVFTFTFSKQRWASSSSMASEFISDVINPELIHEFFIYKGIIWGEHTSTLDILKQCEQFEYRSDDVVVATFLRSGTTLTQEIVWQIVNNEHVTKDATYGALWNRFPFLELNEKRFLKDKLESDLNPIDSLPNWTTKRLIKTHLPFFLIRDQFEKVNPKMVVVMRNPKDNVVSCFNFAKGLGRLKDGVMFEDFCRFFKMGYYTYGDFRDFNLEYWSLRSRENVLIVQYENLVHQPFQEVRNIALFLGYSLSADKIATIVHNTSFGTMSKNEGINWSLKSGDKFLRKGKVGDWKNWFTVAQNEAMDFWISQKLDETDLKFIYE